jgi:purine-binding chemotaxis protein CheW
MTGPELPRVGAATILRERARALARPEVQDIELAAGPLIELLEFRLADERYAVEAACVQEVHPLKALTPLPCTPPFVVGVVSVRGQIVTVIDLKRFFGLPERGLTDLHRIVLVGEGEIGLLADMTVGLGHVKREALQPPLPTLAGIGADYVKGITPDGLVVLDIPRILSDPRMVVDEQPEDANE